MLKHDVKNFYILATNLNVQYNYFDKLFSDLCVQLNL